MDTENPHESTGPEPVDAGTRAALARLELVVTRRLDGMLLGDHRGLVPGPGTEPGEAREYEAGDDVRSMDWSVTARTTVPHIRQKIADRELETWIVVDLGPSIDVAGSYRTKRELVLAAVRAQVGVLDVGVVLRVRVDGREARGVRRGLGDGGQRGVRGVSGSCALGARRPPHQCGPAARAGSTS